jgi:hypothetical protein
MKTLSPEARRARYEHDVFIVMLQAAITWPEKWDASAIIGTYWASAFPGVDIQEGDFDNNLIDRIRKQLLINAGLVNPLLEDTSAIKRIKKEITF